jgi:subtilisin-like proprotein convertase family protein
MGLMNWDKSFRWWSILVLVLVLVATLAGAADSVGVHYWNGDRRVDLALALDEALIVGCNAAAVDAVRLAKAVPTLRERRPEAISSAVHLRFAACADRAALDLQMKSLAGAADIAEVRGVLYYPNDFHRRARQLLTHRLALKVRPGQDVAKLATRHRLVVREQVAGLPDTYILEARDDGLTAALDAANALYETEGVVYAAPLIGRRHARRALPNDPLFAQQWHLWNTGQVPGAVAGNDIDVRGAWDYATGVGINIAIVDDGLQIAHPDLAPNVRVDLCIDLNHPGRTDPSPESGNTFDNHGTVVAGLAAARGDNGLGVCGAAPRASLVGVRLISDTVATSTDQDDADAMLHLATPAAAADRVSVSNNAWGPDDDGMTLDGAGPLMRDAQLSGVTNGRGGKGIVYVWAGGNGWDNYDDANYDGYANSRFVIAVAATGPDGKWTSYGESGACLLVNAPGGEFGGAGMVSTDRTGTTGYASGDYVPASLSEVGTSYSAPLVAGVVALALEANPNLTWRDVQHLLLRTAVRNDSANATWVANGAPANIAGAPRRFSHFYGYGRVDAAAAVAAARHWVPVPQPATALDAPLVATQTIDNTGGPIPDATVGGPGVLTVTGNIAAPADFHAERVELAVKVTHRFRGDLHFQLTSPSGMVTDIPSRPYDNGDDFDWTFTSVAHWGEAPNGNWVLKISDEAPGFAGTLNTWSLKVYGYTDASPTITAIAAQSTNKSTTLTVPLDFGDPDTDITSLKFTATSSDPGLVSDGSLVFGPITDHLDHTGAGTLTITPVPGVIGTATITVTVADATTTASTSFILIVNAVNLPPVADRATYAIAPGQVLNGTLSGRDPEGATLTFSKVADPLQGTVVVNADGTFAYIPNAGAVGGDVFTFQVSDGVNLSAAATVIIVIVDPSLARPRFVLEPQLPDGEDVQQGGAWSFTAKVDVTLLGPSPTLSYRLVTAPAGMVFLAPATGTLQPGGLAITGTTDTLVTVSWPVAAGSNVHVPIVLEVVFGPTAADVQTVLLLVRDLAAGG